MDDVLHILDILKRQAEASLALLVTRRNEWMAEADAIIRNVKYIEKISPISEDILIFENWRQAQMHKVNYLQKQAKALETDISKAKSQYKEAYAKHSAAILVAEDLGREATQKAEDAEMNSQLELSLLRATAP